MSDVLADWPVIRVGTYPGTSYPVRELRRSCSTGMHSPTGSSVGGRSSRQTLRPGCDDRHEALPVMVPFRRSRARPFAVLPHHRLGVLPLGSSSMNTAQSLAA